MSCETACNNCCLLSFVSFVSICFAISYLKDNEKRRAQEEKQARAEREKDNKKKRKDGVRTTLKFKEDECIVDKLLTEIRQGFPLKKRRRTSVDNAKDTLESNSSTCTQNEGIVI